MLDLENYQKEKITINPKKVNNFQFICTIPIFLIIGIPYYLLWKEQFTLELFVETIQNTVFFFKYFALIAMLYILGLILHELIHGAICAFFAEKGFKSIKFGAIWKSLMLYCHCDEPLKIYQYILNLIMPTIILGIIPSIVAIITGNFILVILGIFLTLGGCGDFFMISLLRNEKSDDIVQDHPIEIGCYIYRKKHSCNKWQ